MRQDLASIVAFAAIIEVSTTRPPNEQALWLRIRNVIEAEQLRLSSAHPERQRSFFGRLMGRSWELSLPQLATSDSGDCLVGLFGNGSGPATGWDMQVRRSAIIQVEASFRTSTIAFTQRRQVIQLLEPASRTKQGSLERRLRETLIETSWSIDQPCQVHSMS